MKDYCAILNKSLENIEKLIETPKLMQNFIFDSLKNLDKENDLTNTGKIKINNVIKTIENIEEGNLKKNFQIIYNQTCVLASSALAVVLEEFFINYVRSNWNKIQIKDKKDIKFPLSELLKYNLRLVAEIGKLILEKDNSIKLDDLQSLIRTFDDYFNIKIKISERVKRNIIFYQQCRHIIVHKNSIIDQDFLDKVSENKCNIKNYKVSNVIILDNTDWDNIKKYFPQLIEEIIKKFKNN